MQNTQLPFQMARRIPRRYPYTTARLPDSKVIENRTARTIAIGLKPDKTGGNARPLYIPPFGRRVLTHAEINNLECDDWERLRLIVREEPWVTRRVGEVLGDTINYLIAGGLLALVAGMIPQLWQNIWFWGFLVGFVLLITLVSVPDLWNTLQNVVSASFIYVVIAAIGFGLPIILFGVQNTVMQLSNADWLTIACIATVATLPAILFYLFYGQGLRTLRESLIRDIIRIDPDIRTIDEAEQRYGKLVDDTVGTRQGHIPPTGHVMVLITTALFTLGWSFILPINEAQTITALLASVGKAPVFGFLGVYLFSIRLAFHRYARADINAKTYTYMSIRLLVTLTVAWLLTRLFQPGSSNTWAELAIISLVFALGFVPESIWVVVRDLLHWPHRRINRSSLSGQPHPLRALEGMSLHDEARLLCEGIENIEHLVNYPLVELMLRTRIPAPHLVDLVDQAILYLHVRDADQVGRLGADIKALQILRAYGIRTATQLEQAAEGAKASGTGKQFLALLGPDESQKPERPKRICLILEALKDEEPMVYLRNWRELHRTFKQVYSLKDFSPAAYKRRQAGRNFRRRWKWALG